MGTVLVLASLAILLTAPLDPVFAIGSGRVNPADDEVAKAVGDAGYEVVKASRTNSSGPSLSFSKPQRNSSQGYLAMIKNPIEHFHVFYSTGEGEVASFPPCKGHTKTSVQAASHGCLFATNGGPFSFGTPSCLGNIISNGTTVQIQPGGNENVGLTRNGEFVLGSLTSQDIKRLQFEELVTGFGWLVRSGRILPSKGGEIAPRTALGVTKEGVLMIFEVDGVEKASPPKGLTNYQLAEWFRSLGAWHAVNLDGGGSSVTYYHGKVVSVPTCHDTLPPECERPVTTIACVVG